jgi:hypothetical protein
MKTLLVNGIPYDSTGSSIFIYGSNKTVSLGTYALDTLTLNKDWNNSPESLAWLSTYRNTLKEATTLSLKKAAELQKVQL